jgi:hypothetical protein
MGSGSYWYAPKDLEPYQSTGVEANEIGLQIVAAKTKIQMPNQPPLKIDQDADPAFGKLNRDTKDALCRRFRVC